MLWGNEVVELGGHRFVPNSLTIVKGSSVGKTVIRRLTAASIQGKTPSTQQSFQRRSGSPRYQVEIGVLRSGASVVYVKERVAITMIGQTALEPTDGRAGTVRCPIVCYPLSPPDDAVVVPW